MHKKQKPGATINDLLEEFGLDESHVMTWEKFQTQKTAIEAAIAAKYNCQTSEIRANIRTNNFPCTDPLVDDWISLMAFESVLEPE